MSVPVALLPVPRMQFFDASGTPLAGGLVYTYNAGTSTPAPTYTDSTGTVLNANPVVLDAGGEAQIWLADQSYRIAVANSSNVQQWMTDNVSAYQILQSAQNITLAGVTSDPPVAAGELGYRSDLARIRFANTAWDSIPGLATVDTFSNKTLDVTQNTIKTATNVAGHYLRNNAANYVDSPILAGDYPVFLPSGPTHAIGAVPDPGSTAGITRFLREDATWQNLGGIGYKIENITTVPVTVANADLLIHPLIAFSLPANELGINQALRFRGSGKFSISGFSGAATPVIGLSFDGTFVISIPCQISQGTVIPWAFDATYVQASVGTSGSMVGFIFIQSFLISPTNGMPTTTQNSFVYNTTLPHMVGLSIQWDSLTGTRTITQESLIVERLG